MSVQLETTIGREELLRRFYARDPANNGDFLVGVLSTGIYCLPACRARSPKPENVRFFADPPAARSAGLRACKRCRPDDFYRSFDPDLERVRALCTTVRADPAAFTDTAALAGAARLGATKLNALLRHHYHITPAELLARARVRKAQELLLGGRRGVLEAAEGSGFESPSAFHDNFRRLTGMTPAAYRALGREDGFRVSLPEGFRAEELLGFLGRDEQGRTERVLGGVLNQALQFEDVGARLELELGAREAFVRLHADRRLPVTAWRAAHRRVTRWLGFESDPGTFERRATRSKEIARLVRGRSGLRVPCSGSAFEGLVWVIVGAQVNVAFASTCRRALIELAGTPLEGGYVAHPTPEQVAGLDYADLQRRQYSRRKAEYLIDAARAITRGELDLEGVRDEPVPAVEARLKAVRGLGPWSVQYMLMRAYGFEDCAPIGDVALAEALRRFFERPERPAADEATRLMRTFAPHRSLATYHLWKTLS